MKYLTYILIGLLCCLLTYCGTEYFHKPVVIEKKVIQEKIIEKEKEVIKWKEAKSKIHYRTKFDTVATIDTVYAELLKCDTIVKMDSIIIASQDTIIIDQKELISSYKKDLKREKRKTFFTKVVAGVAIIVTILLVK
jgi:hypothetical protein